MKDLQSTDIKRTDTKTSGIWYNRHLAIRHLAHQTFGATEIGTTDNWHSRQLAQQTSGTTENWHNRQVAQQTIGTTENWHNRHLANRHFN
jgi:hypothetical protein